MAVAIEVPCRWCGTSAVCLPGTAIHTEGRCNPCFWIHKAMREAGKAAPAPRLTPPPPEGIVSPTPFKKGGETSGTNSRAKLQGVVARQSSQGMATPNRDATQLDFNIGGSRPNSHTEVGKRRVNSNSGEHGATRGSDGRAKSCAQVGTVAEVPNTPVAVHTASAGLDCKRCGVVPVPMTGMSCIECAADATYEWKASRKGRR